MGPMKQEGRERKAGIHRGEQNEWNSDKKSTLTHTHTHTTPLPLLLSLSLSPQTLREYDHVATSIERKMRITFFVPCLASRIIQAKQQNFVNFFFFFFVLFYFCASFFGAFVAHTFHFMKHFMNDANAYGICFSVVEKLQ